LSGLVGAALGAGGVILANWLLTGREERMQVERIAADKQLKEMEFARLDAGVRRQVIALLKDVSAFTRFMRETGDSDLPYLQELRDRLRERVFCWEVPTAFTDAEAELLYRITSMLNLMYKALTDIPASDDRVKATKSLTSKLSERIREFWSLVGDDKTLENFNKPVS
jgi:hypothetical protein